MLTLQYVPQIELNNLDSTEKINRLLRIVKSDKIVLMEGRLKPQEETELIELTMEQINKTFKGVEICTIYPDQKENIQFFARIRLLLANMILGNRQGLTIIGPASVVKEIKRNPNKIELLTRSSKKRPRE